MIIYPQGNNLNPLNQNFVNLIVNFCWLYTDGYGPVPNTFFFNRNKWSGQLFQIKRHSFHSKCWFNTYLCYIVYDVVIMLLNMLDYLSIYHKTIQYRQAVMFLFLSWCNILVVMAIIIVIVAVIVILSLWPL